MLLRFRLLVYGVLVGLSGAGAMTLDSLVAMRHRDLALFFFAQNCLDSAAQHQAKALHYFRQHDQLHAWLDAQIAASNLLYQHGYTSLALLKLSQSVGDSIWRKPQDSTEWDALGRCYLALADVQSTMLLREAQTLMDYEMARDILVNRLQRCDAWIALHLWRPLAAVYTRKGNFPEAKAALDTACQLAMQERNAHVASVALRDLARLQMQRGSPADAIETLRKALLLPRQFPAELAAIHAGFQQAWVMRNNPGSALIHGRLAAQFFRTCGDSCKAELAYVLAGNAMQLLERRNFREARQLLEEAHQLLRAQSAGDYPPQLASIYENFGQLYLAWSEPEEALRWYQQALMAEMPAFREKDYRLHPPVALVPGTRIAADALAGKAEAFYMLYQRNRRAEFLELALASYERSFYVETLLHRFFPKDFSIALPELRLRQRLQQALNIALTPDPMSPLFSDFQSRAFALADEHKKMRLLEACVHHGVLNPLRLPSLLPDSSGFRIAELQALIPDKDRTYISYSLGADKIFAFIITRTSTRISSIPLDFPLDDWATQLRRSLEWYGRPGADYPALNAAYARLAVQLYLRLIAPLEYTAAMEPRLTIIPDGVLYGVPFEALLTASPAASAPADTWPYLLHRYRISYGLSLGLQVDLMRQSRRVYTGLLGVAPHWDNSTEQTEVSLFRTEQWQQMERIIGGKWLLRQQATPTNFKLKAPRFGVLYLATTAQANPVGGPPSFLALSDGQGGMDSLKCSDLFAMKLKADITVLERCTFASLETAILLPLSFFYAGSGAVLLPFWPERTDSSSTMPMYFLENVKAGQGKRDALWKAKKRMIQANADVAHPANWAAWTLWGDMGAREKNLMPVSAIVWWLALALTLAVLGGLLYQRFIKPVPQS